MEEGTESEQISDDFICAVCLDILYKPVVLACGHVSCFWCCQRSMNMRCESHCPLCRQPYHHFPAICQMLHFLLKKIYPVSYNRRKTESLEDEKQSSSLLRFSPDIDSLVTSEDQLGFVGQSSDLNSEGNSSVNHSSTEEKKSNGESSAATCKQVSVADVLCVACKQLLFRPVVLNCGHVYCESCVIVPDDGMLKCQVCECRHPCGFPKVCKELDHFLEEQFSLEYAPRRNSTQFNQQLIQNGNSSKEDNTQGAKCSFPTEENFLQWWTVHGSKFHESVGCDACGMCPIIGDRYQCQDCTEKSGYDLCGDCYSMGLKVPGRFNQKHTPEHKLELIKPRINRDVIYRLLRGQLAVVSAAAASRSRSDPPGGSPEFVSPALDDDEDDVIIDGPIISPNDTREDQSDNHASM